MEQFRNIDERFLIDFCGVIFDTEKDKFYTPKNNYIRIYPGIYINKSKSIYKVWQKELEQYYINLGYKLVCDYEPKFSRKYMVNSKGEVVDIERGQKVLAKRHGKHMLWENGKESSVHVLVYKAFVGDFNGVIIHKDGNKFNNHIDNLYLKEFNEAGWETAWKNSNHTRWNK